ncbi:hypothetical protein ACQ4PT_056011 [Festuca glaucescens]
MERTPEEAALGALGLAGICCETLRVIRSRPPAFPFLFGVVITLSLSLLVHVAASRALFSDAVAATCDTSGAGFVRIAANWASFTFAEAAILCVIVLQSLVSTTFSVLSVASGYSGFAPDAERDARAVARDLRQVPRFFSRFLVSVFRGDSRLAARLIRTGLSVAARVAVTSCVAFPLLLGYTAILAVVAALTHLPRPALLVVGGTAFLAGEAHVGAVWRVACVLSVMEDGARGFHAIHGSDELLAGAGKFWAAAAVFTTLDGCAVAAQLAFGALVVEDRMGVGVWVRVALGVALAAVLWAAVMAGLVAQVVVYFVCKRCCQRPDGTAEKSLADVGRRGRATATRSRTRR